MTDDKDIQLDKYKYVCMKCNYGTNIKHSLLHHNETILHKTGKRGKKNKKIKEEFKCDKCEYKSTNKNNHLTHVLNNHSTKEERKKKFKFYCDKCDFGVFTDSTFKKHNETLGHKRLNN
jgi:hypothetical protein